MTDTNNLTNLIESEIETLTVTDKELSSYSKAVSLKESRKDAKIEDKIKSLKEIQKLYRDKSLEQLSLAEPAILKFSESLVLNNEACIHMQDNKGNFQGSIKESIAIRETSKAFLFNLSILDSSLFNQSIEIAKKKSKKKDMFSSPDKGANLEVSGGSDNINFIGELTYIATDKSGKMMKLFQLLDKSTSFLDKKDINAANSCYSELNGSKENSIHNIAIDDISLKFMVKGRFYGLVSLAIKERIKELTLESLGKTIVNNEIVNIPDEVAKSVTGSH